MAKRGKIQKKETKKEEVQERPIRFRRYEYLFLIVCEDENTEPAYFSTYKAVIPEETLYLESVGAGRDPKGVVEWAIREKQILAKRAKKEVDEVWVVFDKDDADKNKTTIRNFEDAFSIAGSNDFKIAYSNEVFELWFLLHFMDVDENIPLPRAEIYRLLKDVFQAIDGYEEYEYDHYKVDERTIEIVVNAGDRDAAIERAEKLLVHHGGTAPIAANPSTTVHLLVQELLGWIKYYSYVPSK